MATASTIKEGIKQEFLECPICLDAFKNPRCLPCLHAGCSDCLQGWMNGKRKFLCPICKADTKVPRNGVQGFPVAFHVNALQNYIQNCGPSRPEIPCHNKKDQLQHDNATVKCLDCNVYYCSSCNKAHTLVAVAEHHETLPLSDLTQEHFQKASQKQVTFCQQHPTCPKDFLEEEQALEQRKKEAKEAIEVYQQQLTDIDQKLSSLGVTNFSPDDAIVQQHKELQNKAARPLEETMPPDLSIQNTNVTSTRQSVVDMKQEMKTQPHKVIRCLNRPVDGIVLLDEFLIIWYWKPKNTPTEFFVSGKNARDAEKLKQKLENVCPHAFRMVLMKRDGNEVLVITEGSKYPLHHIKMLNINDDRCETFQFKDSMCPWALAVDRHNDIIFTDLSPPTSIKKWTKGGVQTICENEDLNSALGIPWHVCVNINDDIIVSDNGKKSIIIFEATGIVRKTYYNFTAGDYHNPKGVCTDDQGDIYVCDWHGHCIHRLTKSGLFLEKILTHVDGLWSPTAVKYSDGMLVVGQSDGSVKYFKMQ